MYQLFYYPSNANAAPHMLLEEIGASYELVLVERKNNSQKSQDYLRINPAGRIPTLIDDDQAIFEAAAIMLHLVDQHPEAEMAPKLGTPGRAHFYQWLVFLTNSLQEELMIWQYPERLAGSDQQALAIVKQGAEKRAEQFLTIIEDHLAANGPYFMGDKLTALDLYLTMLARWAKPMSSPPRARPNVAALLDLVIKRPAVKRAYQNEGIESDIA